MSTAATYVDTPYYVLMEGSQRLGPEVVPASTGTQCVAVYGFSDRSRFDKFCANCRLALVPYPLTRSYLQHRADTPGDGLNLVVVNADGPGEPCLHAATMEAVLQGQQDRTLHVTAAYDLTFESEVAAYRVTVNRSLKTARGR
ncbi:MAG: hypothetical protein ACYC6Y_12930 [Thermoguttaceae bacterium]